MKKFFFTLASLTFTLMLAAQADAAKPGNSGSSNRSSVSHSSSHMQMSHNQMSHNVNKSFHGPSQSNKGLHQMMRTNYNRNYHTSFGTQRSFGYCYTGRHHNHWSYCYFDSRYSCNLYWCPCTFGYFYFCPQDVCYYPVSYVPYTNYCGCTTVIDPTCPVVPYQTVVPN